MKENYGYNLKIHFFLFCIGVFPYGQYDNQRYFTEGTGSILFAELMCDGTELALAQCSSYPSAGYCSHSSDVGVRCDEIELSGTKILLMLELQEETVLGLCIFY